MSDYLTALRGSERELLRAKTERVRTLVGSAAENVYEIGRELIQVKTILGHGHFLSWLHAEFEWSEWTARNFMNVALKLSKPAENGKISLYAPSALYLLAGGSTPDGAREEAEALASAGKRVTHSVAADLKEKHQAAEEAFATLTPEELAEVADKANAPPEPDWRAERNRHLRAALAAAKKVGRATNRDRAIQKNLEKWLGRPKVWAG